MKGVSEPSAVSAAASIHSNSGKNSCRLCRDVSACGRQKLCHGRVATIVATVLPLERVQSHPARGDITAITGARVLSDKQRLSETRLLGILRDEHGWRPLQQAWVATQPHYKEQMERCLG